MKNIILSGPEIQSYFGKYAEYSRRAVNSKDINVDLKAAFYAPVLLLQDPKNTFHRFEETMDKVLFHLDCAYTNSLDQDTKIRVGLSAQVLLEFHITLLELKLRESKQRLGWDIFTTLLTSITSIGTRIRSSDDDGFADDVSKLFSACVSFFVRTKMTKDDEKEFYAQLLKVYGKVLNSSVYSKQYDLVKNSFIRVDSKKLLIISLYGDGFAITEKLLRKFGFHSDELGKFLRLLFDELKADSRNMINVAPEDIIKARKNIKSNKLPNQHELDEIVFYLFKYKIISRSLLAHGLSKSLLYIKEFGETSQEVNDLVICVIQNITSQAKVSDFIDIMVFSKENNISRLAIKEELLRAYEEKFRPSVVSLTKYKMLILFFAPILCIVSMIIMWKSESSPNKGWNVVTGFFSSLWHTLIAATPYVLGILLFAFGIIILMSFAINFSILHEHEKKVKELENLLVAKI